MSNPKRYTHKHLYGSDGYINESLFSDEKDCVAPEGEYVLHEDYALLKAEVERLRSQFANSERQVERLRKAGDAVALDYAERIEIEAGDTAKNLMKKLPVLREWNAAKEGKPSV